MLCAGAEACNPNRVANTSKPDLGRNNVAPSPTLNLREGRCAPPCSRRAAPARWGRRGGVPSDVKIAQGPTLVHAAYAPPEPMAAHSPRCGSKRRILRKANSSMTDPLNGRAAHDLPRTPPSVTLESNAVTISCVPPSILKVQAGPSKFQLDMGQFRLLDVVARSERDGGEGGTVSN